jgi:hypothetical protein
MSRLGHLIRVTPENPAVMTEDMLIWWGTPEESEAAKTTFRDRCFAEGRAVLVHGVLHLPDGTTRTLRSSDLRRGGVRTVGEFGTGTYRSINDAVEPSGG